MVVVVVVIEEEEEEELLCLPLACPNTSANT